MKKSYIFYHTNSKDKRNFRLDQLTVIDEYTRHKYMELAIVATVNWLKMPNLFQEFQEANTLKILKIYFVLFKIKCNFTSSLKGHNRVSMLKVPPNQMKLCINHIKILDKK